MANLPLLAELLVNRPQLATPSYANAVVAALGQRLSIAAPGAKRLDGGEEEPGLRPVRSPVLTEGGIFVLPIVGGLMHRGDSFDAECGAQSYTNIQNRLVMAMAERQVKGILLDIDSPGGMASGCFELADMIADMATKKPVWAISNARAFSAAYAIGCAADRLYCTPSGEVGSIGVVMVHIDHSKAISEAGLAVTYIYAGEHKIDGNPANPLPASVRELFQADIDASYDRFVGHVAKHRGLKEAAIRETKALKFAAEKAVEKGLADEVASFDAVMSAFSRELNPIYRVSPTGAVTTMSKSNEAPRIEGFEEALKRARDDGMAVAQAAADKQIIEAYTKGRSDAVAILSHESAKGRTAAAVKLVGNTQLSVESALGILADLPTSEDSAPSAYRQKLTDGDPKVHAAPGAERPDAVKSYQSSVSGHVAALLAQHKKG